MSEHCPKETRYRPVKDGIEKSVKSVSYVETKPADHLSGLVHCFWELRTETSLPEDFQYHVLPDACVNILFDQLDTKICAVTALQTEHTKLNLGRDFHFVGIQLLPGVWRGDPDEIVSELVDKPYVGGLSLMEINEKLSPVDFIAKQLLLSEFAKDLIDQKLLEPNSTTAKILSSIEDIKTVADMALVAHMSPRQLQRTLKKSLRLSPHDFLKILRIQQSFKQDYLSYYADQSHFIHSFRNITGYTPTKYNKKYDV